MTARTRFVQLALEQLGRPALWAQRGPEAFDCSGLVAWALEAVGVKGLRATHNAQMFHDESPALETFSTPTLVLPGDLLFYGHDAASVSHIAVALNGGMALSADGATPHITSLTEALKNPANRVRVHATFRFRPDLPYFAAHRNTWADAPDVIRL